jgi:hypothetical protein
LRGRHSPLCRRGRGQGNAFGILGRIANIKEGSWIWSTRFQWVGGVKILGFLEGGEAREGDVERGRLVGAEEIDPVRETRVAGNLPERGIFSKSEETIRAIRG